MKVLIPFYSMYGHIYRMAQAVAEGVSEVEGAEPLLRRVPETLTDEILENMGAVAAQKTMSGVELCMAKPTISATMSSGTRCISGTSMRRYCLAPILF